MTWNEQESSKRVGNNDFSTFEVNVADLKKTMDFANLGKHDVRKVDGAHLYSDVSNIHLALSDAGNDLQKQRKLIRAVSVLRRIQSELAKDEEVGRIQSQGARLHCLCFKP